MEAGAGGRNMDQRQRLKQNQNLATINGVSGVYALIGFAVSTFVAKLLQSRHIE
jgi:hypothetical protein